jgi:hypothetical protein
MARIQSLDKSSQKQTIEKALCSKDREHWLLNHAKIETADGDIATFGEVGGLKQAQRMANALRYHCRYVWKCPIRILTLKSRQVGMSTDEEAFMYHSAKFGGLNGAVIADDLGSAEYLFEKFSRYHQNDVLDQPTLKTSNVRQMRFGDRPGRVEVSTAQSPNALRSRTLQIIHGSEVAYWGEDGPKLHKACMKFVGRRPNTSINYETTAQGEDPLFYPMWQNATKHCKLRYVEDDSMPFGFKIERTIDDEHGEWNGFYPLFISVLVDERCYIKFDSDAELEHLMKTLDAEEKWLLEDIKAAPEFLKWRRITLATECNGDINDLHQEYPVTAEQAFIMSGHPRFRHDILTRMPIEPGTRGFLRREEKWTTRIEFVDDSLGELTIFRSPIANHRYVCAVDPSQGIPSEGTRCEWCSGDTDETSVQVYDIDSGAKVEQVALVAGAYNEEYLVEPVLSMLLWYNCAFCVIERVGGYGDHLTFELQKRYHGDRIFRMEGNRTTGLRVTAANRTSLLADVAALLHQNSLVLHSERTGHHMKVVKRATVPT